MPRSSTPAGGLGALASAASTGSSLAAIEVFGFFMVGILWLRIIRVDSSQSRAYSFIH
jgi:hypothetical protein